MATLTPIKADQTISVQDFIAMRKSDDVTYYNFSILEYLNGFDMFITNVLYDYEEELQDMSVYVQLTDVELLKYRLKPYLFAYDVYGSREMAFIIMMLNGIIDPKDFNFSKIKIIRYGNLNTILSRIASVNDEYINNNKSKLKKDFKESEGSSIWTE